jgi:hypothetical protein
MAKSQPAMGHPIAGSEGHHAHPLDASAIHGTIGLARGLGLSPIEQANAMQALMFENWTMTSRNGSYPERLSSPA